MSSATIIPIKENLFNTYLVGQDEDKETEVKEEKPSEQTASLAYEPYSPKRASFHTTRGKIKRFFA